MQEFLQIPGSSVNGAPHIDATFGVSISYKQWIIYGFILSCKLRSVAESLKVYRVQ